MTFYGPSHSPSRALEPGEGGKCGPVTLEAAGGQRKEKAVTRGGG